jgi:hypothetical protein
MVTIKSLPPEIVIMIIEMLSLEDALALCKTLKLREQVAVQYFYYDKNDIYFNVLNLKPNNCKFLLKNKRYQMTASSFEKTNAALRTFDLDFVKKYIEEFKPDVNDVLTGAAWIGFTEAVKLLLTDYSVGLSVKTIKTVLNFAEKCKGPEMVNVLRSYISMNQD